MARNSKTDEFIDIDIDSLDGVELDLGLEFPGSDDELLLDLGLGDGFGDYQTDNLLAIEVVPIEESLSKLEEILETTIAYDKGTKHVGDVGKNSRSKKTIDKILSKIKTEDNIAIIHKEHKRLNSIISSHMSDCYRCVESGTPFKSLLSQRLMRIGIVFDSDTEAREVDNIVSLYANETALRLDERNRQIALNNEGIAKIDLDSLDNVQLHYIDMLRFNPISGKLFVTCPSCGIEVEHPVLESTRVMSDVDRTGIYVKHNPLFCSCGVVSILKDEVVDDVSMRIRDKIRAIDSVDDMSRMVAAIDIGVLNNVPNLSIDGEARVEDITDSDCENFLVMQKNNISNYNKKFFLRHLTSPTNVDTRYSMLNAGSFDLLTISNYSIKECAIGCIKGSPYFNIISELSKKKDMVNLYIVQYSKLSKILDYISRDHAISGEESIELSYAIEKVNLSLFKLGLARTKSTLNIEKLNVKIVDKLKDAVTAKLGHYKSLLVSCDNEKRELVNYLCENSNSLFRFMPVKHFSSSQDYYKEFDSVEQGDKLINAVAPIVARYNWTVRAMKTLTFKLSKRSRCKLKVTDSYDSVYDTMQKYIEVCDETDAYAYPEPDSISKMPIELIRLTHDVEGQNYYRFIYNVIALRNHTMNGTDLVLDTLKAIHDVEVSEEELRVYELYKNIDKFEQHMSLLALEFKEEDIIEFLKKSSFNCRNMRVRGGKRTIKTYMESISELRPHTPEKCILDLHKYKSLVCNLFLINSINNLITTFKDYHELVLRRVVSYVDSQYINVATTGLLEDLHKYNEVDLSERLYYDIDIANAEACEVYKCIVNYTPLYTHMLAESVDDSSENKGNVSSESFMELVRAEIELTPELEFNLGLYTIMEVLPHDNNIGRLDNLIPEKYKEHFSKFYSVFSKSKYTDELKESYHYDEDTFMRFKDEFNQLMNYISMECNPLIYESIESKVKEYTIL